MTSLAEIQKRLKNVSGQIDGISKMVGDEKDCLAIITQLKSARAGLERVGTLMAEGYLLRCLPDGESADTEKAKKIVAELAKK